MLKNCIHTFCIKLLTLFVTVTHFVVVNMHVVLVKVHAIYIKVHAVFVVKVHFRKERTDFTDFGN